MSVRYMTKLGPLAFVGPCSGVMASEFPQGWAGSGNPSGPERNPVVA